MYERVVTVQFKQGMRDEAKRITEESIIPAAKQEKGFVRLESNRAGILHRSIPQNNHAIT
jgi:hypothetical protein